MEKSYYTYWVPFTPKDCILRYFKCSKCGGETNNPYPYCPWCGRPMKGIKGKEEGKRKCLIKKLLQNI